jgi:outer membrane protein assembly factor BamB
VVLKSATAAAAVLLAELCHYHATANDWPAFRGPAQTGISEETRVPLNWSAEKNIRWKAPLPAPGNSSPVVSRDRVFITCATDNGKHRGLYCYDRRDGRLLWQRLVDCDESDPTHATNPYCGSSPACDGTRVVVWHGSAGLHCYDYDGQPLWSRDLGTFRHIWGYGSSPIFYHDSILLNCGPGERTFVTAIDRRTGEARWQVDEAGGDEGQDQPGQKPKWIGSWSTPVVTKVDGRDQVLVSLPHHVQAYDPSDGKILWSCDGLGDLVYTSVLVTDGIGVAMSGYFGPAVGFKLGGSGNVTETNRLWHGTAQNPQRIGSGVIVGEHIYLVNEPSLVQCLELKTGKEVWKDRLGGEKVWASIVAAEGRLYVTDEAGTTYVFAPSRAGLEILAKNSVGEPTNSTLALSNGQIFLRTFGHLICIEE